MIIVNQEKTYLVNFNNVCQVSLAANEEETKYAIAVQTIDEEVIIMGEYKTEERAKEVLNEIIRTFSFKEISGDFEEINALINLTKLARYEMPEE